MNLAGDNESNRYAFGDPDGSRSDTLDLVSFTSVPGGANLDFTGLDRRSRVIVGQKGSGKTVYLRKLHETVGDDESMAIADESVTQLLRTKEVLQVAHWYSERFLTEVWMQIWRSGILMSVASILLHAESVKRYVSVSDQDLIRKDLKSLFPKSDLRQRGVFASVRRLIGSASNGTELSSLVDRPEWDDLEESIAEALRFAPPVFIFIDTIDEELRSAPMYWLRCQKGLFYQVMRFLRSPGLGARLHIVIAIRDLVLSSVYRSEHAPRYRSDRHIRLLTWGEPLARRFLEHKVQQLDNIYWKSARAAPQTLEEWLGFSMVRNRLGYDESVSEYVLRHTHMLPRDVMLIGNAIGQRSFYGPITSDDILASVSNVARLCGQANLDVVSNQLLSDLIPVGASDQHFDEFYTSSQEYSAWASDQVKHLLHACPSLWPTASDIEHLRAGGREAFDVSSDLPSVLWQNGLLGYLDGDRQRFYSLSGIGSFGLPEAEQYVFHPSLREVAGLPVGPAVVVPDYSD